MPVRYPRKDVDQDTGYWFTEALGKGWIPVDSTTGFFIIVPHLPSDWKVINVFQLREEARILGNYVGALDSFYTKIRKSINESSRPYEL